MLDSQSESIGEQVLTGGLWMGCWRWTARLMGFVSTIILARLLVPEDFGIIATGAIVTGFFGIMIQLGTDSYLIRLENPDRDDYDSAWTLRLILISIASIGVFFAAQPAADYFEDQRIVEVLQVLAISGCLAGLANIGLVMYRRDLKFRIIALIGISQRFAATITTIGLAFWLRNYWAMVIGEIIFMLVGLILSFTHHSYRPRFTLLRLREQWDFCKWIVVQNFATFLQSQSSSFVIIKYFGIELLGVFSMAGRLAVLPTQQILKPVLPPIYSGLAKKQHDPEVFVASVLKVIGATAALMLPAATVFACLSEEIVTLVLGERWSMAIPMVAPLTLAGLLSVLGSGPGTVLTLKGRVRLLAGLKWFSAVVALVVLLVAVQWLEIIELIWLQLIVGVIILVLYYAFMLSTLQTSVFALLVNFYRPLFASLVMAIVIYQTSILIDSAWLIIACGIVFGGITYLLTAILLWKIAGGPDSGEALLVSKFAKVVGRQLNKSPVKSNG